MKKYLIVLFVLFKISLFSQTIIKGDLTEIKPEWRGIWKVNAYSIDGGKTLLSGSDDIFCKVEPSNIIISDDTVYNVSIIRVVEIGGKEFTVLAFSNAGDIGWLIQEFSSDSIMLTIKQLSTNKEQYRALIKISPIIEGDLSDDINKNFIEACTNGDLTKVTDLFGKGANIEYQDDDGRTPLMHACHNGHIEIVKFLLSKNSNVNASNNKGLTALFMSICQKRDNKTLKNNKLKIMKLLIKNGADVNARVNMDFYGKMTIMELIKFNEKTERQEGGQICPESIKILKAAGAR